MEYKQAVAWMEEVAIRSVSEFHEVFDKFMNEESSNTKLKAIGYHCKKVTEDWDPKRRLSFSMIRRIVETKYGDGNPFKMKNGKNPF